MKKNKKISIIAAFILIILATQMILFACSKRIEDKTLYKHTLNKEKNDFVKVDNSYIKFNKNQTFELLLESPYKPEKLPLLKGVYSYNVNLFLKFNKSSLSYFENKYNKILNDHTDQLLEKNSKEIVKNFQNLYNFKNDNGHIFSIDDIVFFRIAKINTPGRELDGIYMINTENTQNMNFVDKNSDDSESEELYNNNKKNYIIFKLENNIIYNYNVINAKFEEYSTYEVKKDLFVFNYKTITKENEYTNQTITFKNLNMLTTEVEYQANKSKFEEYEGLKDFKVDREVSVLVSSYYSE